MGLPAPQPSGTLALDGEPTSVTVVGDHILVGVNTSESFTAPSGHVAVVGLDGRTIERRCDVGGQPDSLAAGPRGSPGLGGRERARRGGGRGRHPAAAGRPPGDLRPRRQWRTTNCDSVRIVELTGLAEVAGSDPEPEFVDVNAAGVAAVTLQENNHIVLVELASGEVIGHFSAGTVDLEAIDTVEDGLIAASGSLEGCGGSRMRSHGSMRSAS